MSGKIIDRAKWPVPDSVKGASAVDAFVWYICQAWSLFFGGDEEIETLFHNDLTGFFRLKRGDWQIELNYLGELDDR